jgi:Txe/YoeB family toxin of Txe-Axe toxin-antitoxin module
VDEAEKVYNVSVMPYAKRKMEGHLAFLAEASEIAARKLRFAMHESIGSLSRNPLSWPRYEPAVETELELHSKLCSKRYRIVFHVVGEQVNVVDIQDSRQNTDKNIV